MPSSLRKILSPLFFIFVLFVSALAHAEPCPEASCSEYLVKFTHRATNADIQAAIHNHSLSVINYFESSGIYHLDSDHSRPQEDVLKELNADPSVMFAEPNYSVVAEAVPNDPLLPDLWAFNNIGQYSGTPGDDIGMSSLWDYLIHPLPIVVAVLDSGIDYKHEDLAANMWKNPGEIPGNGIDDDGNGFVDDVYGYNFYGNTSDPADDYFHGTHVAGTIGAVGNNGIGVIGINPGVKLMAVKFMSSTGVGPLSAAIEGIDYAVKNGAKIINNSWDFTYPGLTGLPSSPALEPVQSLRAAIVAADQAGVIFVAAAGNDGTNNDLTPKYPASYSVGNIISVAATDNKDAVPPFSDYGATSVDMGAPGVMIESTYPTWKITPPYHYLSGTSMATPHVSGAAALLWAENPGLTHRQVIDRLLQGVTPVAGLSGKSKTGGTLDVAQSFALGSTTINHPPVAYAGAAQSRTVGDTVSLQGTATDADGDKLTFQWTLTSPSNLVTTFNVAQISFPANEVGTYIATLVASDGKSTSVPSTLKISVSALVSTNQAPVAYSGPNQARHVGDTVLLSGSGTDANGDPLTYQWTLAVPTGSHASLSSATVAKPTFLADASGTYSATLVVSDGKSYSPPVTAKIYVTASTTTTANTAPVASAGPNQLRHAGDTVLLIGKGTDANGDPLTYQWTLVAPSGSKAVLSSATSATASFAADVIGTYKATLVVNDGKANSAPATATIYIVQATTASLSLLVPTSSESATPTLLAVIAAQNETAPDPLDPAEGGGVGVGETIQLDGSQSAISGGDPMDFEWVMIEKPEGSASIIDSADQPVSNFRTDVEGRYTVQLVVYAGKSSTSVERSFIAKNGGEQTPQPVDTGGGVEATPSPSAGGCSLQME